MNRCFAKEDKQTVNKPIKSYIDFSMSEQGCISLYIYCILIIFIIPFFYVVGQFLNGTFCLLPITYYLYRVDDLISFFPSSLCSVFWHFMSDIFFQGFILPVICLYLPIFFCLYQIL